MLSLAGTASAEPIRLQGTGYTLSIEPDGFRYSIERIDHTIAADKDAGLSFDGERIASAHLVSQRDTVSQIAIATKSGREGAAKITLLPHAIQFDITVNGDPADVTLRMAGQSPVYGLGDRGGQHTSTNLAGERFDIMHVFGHPPERTRWISTFAIFPKQRFAGVLFNTDRPSVDFDGGAYTMTVSKVKTTRAVYFVGDPSEIYAAYREAREAAGFPNLVPQFRLFELGWESWDALRWRTNAATVRDTLAAYLDHGYPIRWACTGSGFWADGHTTTSFGMFNREKYPDNDGFRDWLHAHDIKWLIGQRTNFVIHDTPGDASFPPYVAGPFTDEGLQRDYYARGRDGERIVVKSRVFPKADCYMLDGTKPAAVKWFADLVGKWGVDGMKEDTMMLLDRCDLFNAPMAELHARGLLTIGRNGAFSAPGTLMRMEDMHQIETITRRMPITWLQYAASAAPNVYSDTIGFDGMKTNIIGAQRHAWLCALTAGMSMGATPWEWPAADQAALKKAVDFHFALAPYLFSAAVDAHRDGYPHTMTPLPIAFPDDEKTFDLASADRQMFEWMVGPSLLAAPLLRKDYATRDMADIYLPAGEWIDFETGERFTGPTLLHDRKTPVDKIPAFVGGPAIFVLRDTDERLHAEVFPNSPRGATLNFTFPDGVAKATITNDCASPIATGDVAVVEATGSEKIDVVRDATTGAIRFPIEPNKNFRLVDRR